MREILFRGKRADNGEWVDGFYTCVADVHYILSGIFDSLINGIINTRGYKVIPETVCQFTGLYDKDGRKIFEGDIMRNTGNVVEFCGGNFCINGDSPLSYWTGTEVIGNIYDNPELLKGGNEND